MEHRIFTDMNNELDYLNFHWSWSVLKAHYPSAEIKVSIHIPAANVVCSEIVPFTNHLNMCLINSEGLITTVSLQSCLNKTLQALEISANGEADAE